MASERKEAIKEYKSRTATRGIYAVRCTATGAAWVGSTPTLETVQNMHWFMLRHGHHTNKQLQAVWNEHGEQFFCCETVETLDAETPAVLARDLLKKQQRHWIERLGAAAI